MSQQRQPEGTPAGGEFAAKPHSEAAVTLDVAATTTPELVALHRARTATSAAEEIHAKAAYAYLASEAKSRWTGAAAVRVERSDSDDWSVDAVVDAEGTELAGYLEASSALQMPLSEIQECGWAWRMIDDSGEDELHEGEADSTSGVMRLDQDFAPPVDAPVEPARLQTGDSIVTDSGAAVKVVGDVWVHQGLVRADVELGTLVMDPDIEVLRRSAPAATT